MMPQISLNTGSQKGGYSQFLEMALGWGTPLTLSQAIYHSVLAFTSHLRKTPRSAREASLRLSQVFYEYASGPGPLCCILNYLQNSIAIQSLYCPQGSSSSVFFFPDFWDPLAQAVIGSISSNDFSIDVT